MASKKKTESKRPIESYEHRGKERLNNPSVGLVTPQTDPDTGAKKTYACSTAGPGRQCTVISLATFS